MLAILAETLEAEPRSTATLVYGNRTTASTMLRAEVDALAEQYAGRLVVHHVLSRELGTAARTARAGRIDAALLEELVPGDVDRWFLCGPEQLVEDLSAALPARGGQVLTEVFHTEQAHADLALDVESQVTVTLAGQDTSFALRSSGDTVLDAALREGVDAPYSCAGGACGTCRAKVLLGRAVMDQDHALDDDERAAGYVLTCQAHPVSEELRVSYDA